MVRRASSVGKDRLMSQKEAQRLGVIAKMLEGSVSQAPSGTALGFGADQASGQAPVR
jgi:hypothetical protein